MSSGIFVVLGKHKQPAEPRGVVSTTFVSLLARCKLHGIEPWDLLCLIADRPAHRVLALALAYWRKTLEQPETQQRLAANPFRNVSPGMLR